MAKTYDWRNIPDRDYFFGSEPADEDADREREEAREAWADDEVAARIEDGWND